MADELIRRGHELVSLSRAGSPAWSLQHLVTDVTESASVDKIGAWLAEMECKPELVIQCAGLLHKSGRLPEKSLMQMDRPWLEENISANLVAHMHLAQATNSLVSRSSPFRWVSLSAMVGSISDNALGGWYSYRISKAALNMFVRNLHLEWQRKSPKSIVVALHPGTTDTALSKPFQQNIAKGKLYSKEQTAQRLVDVIENLKPSQSGKLLHWDGSELPF